jgi:pilus retraction protein PilT
MSGPRLSPLVERLLASMDGWGASDLFLTEDRTPAVRVSGEIIQPDLPATTYEDLDGFIDRILLPTQRERYDQTGDLDVSCALPDGRRFRVNLARQRGAISLVARALPLGELTFEELGLPEILHEVADLKRGLVLVTGATGSGKSTTLAALIHQINSNRSLHIVTIEDPIEFVHRDLRSRISQREVGVDTISFESALRHVVRESPDVILIGEMRDQDTMQTALSAALTGHLVFASLHTINASQTLQRILSFFPDHLRRQAALDLSLSLQAVLSQRLVPRSNGKGRVVCVEMLRVNPAAAKLIREQRVDELTDLMRHSEDPGMRTFDEALLERFRAGDISIEVGRAYATNPDELMLAVRGMSTGTMSFREAQGGTISGLDLKALIELSVEHGASDLHVSVGRPPILRVSGQLRPLPLKSLTAADMRLLLYSVMSQKQRGQYELERELDFALALDNGSRFRVNAYYQKGHMAAAMRAIPSKVPDSDSLMLPHTLLDLAQRPQGLLLVVGPTGSGKTTTLSCLIDRINRSRACRIITVEDPIEYTHDSVMATIDQREVYADTQSFSAALKYILRQDPDVIMVGEMRDFETVSAALTAAETGHLVLATLHTNDASQTIDRVVDVFPPHQQSQARSQLASSLLAVVSQRLLLRKDGSGRVPAFELMTATSAIRTLIRESKMHQAHAMMETSKGHGMITMDHSVRELYQYGLVSYEEAARFMRTPSLLGERPANAGSSGQYELP